MAGRQQCVACEREWRGALQAKWAEATINGRGATLLMAQGQFCGREGSGLRVVSRREWIGCPEAHEAWASVGCTRSSVERMPLHSSWLVPAGTQ